MQGFLKETEVLAPTETKGEDYGQEENRDLAAILMIGDGVVGSVAPRGHSLLWDFGPDGNRKAVEAFAEHPLLNRLVSAVEIGLGLGLAFRQYARG